MGCLQLLARGEGADSTEAAGAVGRRGTPFSFLLVLSLPTCFSEGSAF